MAKKDFSFFSFNRGMVSRLVLARIDVERLAMAAELSVNWVARVLGPMILRPGLGFLGSTRNDLASRFLPFIFSTADKALLEFTDLTMRVWVSDAVVTRAAVSTTVTNGDFNTDLTGWTDLDEAGAVSAWVTGGYMGLTGDGTAAAIRQQTVAVAPADQAVEQALTIVIQRGPVTFRLGTTSGGDDLISETTLATGSHSLAFTPNAATIYIRFFSRLKRITLVNSCNIAGAGVMEVPTIWPASALSLIRNAQSADVVFCAAFRYQQQRIERRATRSWSVVGYLPEDGPFMVENVTPTTMTPSVLSGNGTLTASAPYFKTTNVGSLFSLTSTGQSVSQSASAQNVFTSAIRVTGVGTDRAITVVVSGTFSATVTLQRSFDSDTGPWSDTTTTYVAPTTVGFNDGLDNQIVWYRLGVKTGDYVSGTVDMDLSIATGSITGVGRVTAFTSSILVDIEVLVEFGATNATEVWAEGLWSDRRGWPAAVRFFEGRLWWAGKDKLLGSASDAFATFDPDIEGDSGPINRTIGGAQVDTINWMLSLQRLILGGEGAEYNAKSSSLDEPLTPTNFSIKSPSTQGSASVDAVTIDNHGVFVQRGGIRVFGLEIDPSSYDYASRHLTSVVPEIGKPGIVRIAVQRQPDTRVHLVRSDGQVVLLVIDKDEKVNCFALINTGPVDEDGEPTAFVEDAVVLPSEEGEQEDHVYYVVRRIVGGVTKRFLERWAFEEDCIGGTLNLQADSYVTYSGVPTTSIPVPHLEGAQVVAWGDGADLGTFTVTGGVITLTAAVSECVVGLTYRARWKSAKLAQIQMQSGTALNKMKKVGHLGLVLADTHQRGLTMGQDFDHMDDLPNLDLGDLYDPEEVFTDVDMDVVALNGSWGTDARLCLEANAPRPVTVMSAIAEVEAHG